MRFHSTDELTKELLRLRLATEDQLTESRIRHPVSSDPESLLKALEAMHVLTAYQGQKLREKEKGPIVLGPYKLMYQNASGSFARVFRACRIDNEEMIGLKLLRQRYADDPQAVAHFHREAELCMKLKHKNIVPIYEVGEDDGHHYFTMEFVEGGNMRDVMKIRGKLSPQETLRYGLDMAEGLEYALTQGMTHRDFKLSNVLLSSTGVAKLVDFGLAGDESSSADTSVHAVEYATLEKGTGAPRSDPRSDLYFLGSVLYEMASGIPPYAPSKNYEDRKRFARYSGVRSVKQINPNVPEKLAQIITTLMKVNPHERYQTATEAVAAMRSALASFGPDPRATVAPDPAKKGTQTILCVEPRQQHQDLLREYFVRHDFRILMLSSWDRAVNRLKTNPPDCLLVIGDAIDGQPQQVFEEALAWSNSKKIACVLVIPRSLDQVADQLHVNGKQKLMKQPVSLRELRVAINEILNR